MSFWAKYSNFPIMGFMFSSVVHVQEMLQNPNARYPGVLVTKSVPKLLFQSKMRLRIWKHLEK
jgi:hypothetical protein